MAYDLIKSALTQIRQTLYLILFWAIHAYYSYVHNKTFVHMFWLFARIQFCDKMTKRQIRSENSSVQSECYKSQAQISHSLPFRFPPKKTNRVTFASSAPLSVLIRVFVCYGRNVSMMLLSRFASVIATTIAIVVNITVPYRSRLLPVNLVIFCLGSSQYFRSLFIALFYNATKR